MKKIIVTGAEGFIGSHLVEALVIEGHKVRAFCLYNSFNNIGWLSELTPEMLKNVDIILGDIRDFDSINASIKGMEVVYHLAALIAIPYSYKSPESYIDTNVKGTLNVLRASLNNTVNQVIHTSTSEVYGTAQFVPITEQHPIIGQSPYSASKIAADQLAYSFYCSYGLPVSTIRPFNTFGPRQSIRAVIPTIITQAYSGKKNIKLGNINATRDFNFVHDTVRAMIAFLDKSGTFGKVINIGSGVEVSIKDIVEMVSKIVDFELEIDIDAQRFRPEKSEVERLCSSNVLAKKELDWEPVFTLKQGIEHTCTWLRESMHKYNLSDLTYVI